ncbi:hypothetical protein [Croceicoccus marinus]|uniref:Uncharacterized protein n=1 Tax=Croceicoccus marinus TaxID=450378 RepID=A0A1Z1FA40_9SPHN|nr:hypothetical protein [Croceicoccus marinus]ARU15557.1 hypothetical protein A9D14_04390 [Croceicoccus marinus]
MRIVCGLFAALYLCALGILAIGTFGLFGQEQDPLVGAFLLTIGMPWIAIADRIGMQGALVVILAPLVNLALLMATCRLLGRARRSLPSSDWP